MRARTNYFRATTLLVAMMAAAVVAVLAGYGAASAQDECQGDCEPPPSAPETTTAVETSPAEDATNTDREATTEANGPDAALDRALKELVAMPGRRV